MKELDLFINRVRQYFSEDTESTNEEREIYLQIENLKSKLSDIRKKRRVREKDALKDINKIIKEEKLYFVGNEGKISGLAEYRVANPDEFQFKLFTENWGQGIELGIRQTPCFKYENNDELKILKMINENGDVCSNILLGDYVCLIAENYYKTYYVNFNALIFGKVKGITTYDIDIGPFRIARHNIKSIKTFESKYALYKYIREYKEKYLEQFKKYEFYCDNLSKENMTKLRQTGYYRNYLNNKFLLFTRDGVKKFDTSKLATFVLDDEKNKILTLETDVIEVDNEQN